MILMDFNQIMISNIMVQLGNHKNIKLEEDLVRHMVLNSIRGHKLRFGREYGEIIITCDDQNYWRKQMFPYYKANRKKAQNASEIDWSALFQTLNKIREEILANFPYKVIRVPHAEADDVIAVLCEEFYPNEKILIISGDKDFQQLQRHRNIVQYSPVQKKFIVCNNPEMFLSEHIMKGDAVDGIPNFLSPDDCCVMDTRQTPLRAAKLAAWVLKNPEEFCTPQMLRNYRRNEALIDLSKVPYEIRDRVLDQYYSQDKDRSKMFNYFIEHRLKGLMEHISDF